MRRKDVQRLAAELVDAIDALRTEMAMQDATIQRQAAEIERLKGGKQGEFSERGQQQALRPPAQSPARAELPKDPPPSPKDK